MTAQHREGENLLRTAEAKQEQTTLRDLARTGLHEFRMAAAILLPAATLRTAHTPCTPAAHSPCASRGSSCLHSLQPDYVPGRVRSGARERRFSWLALDPEENKQRQGEKHTVPCNLITSVQASGLHTPGRQGPEAKLIRPGRKTRAW